MSIVWRRQSLLLVDLPQKITVAYIAHQIDETNENMPPESYFVVIASCSSCLIPSSPPTQSCGALQFLALDSNVHALQPTNVTVLTYSLPVQIGPMDPAALNLKGRQNFFQILKDIMRVFETACHAVLSNDTLMAELRVRSLAII